MTDRPPIYTAEATVVGGRYGHGKTSDGILNLQLRPPGQGETGANPEQLFAVGYAACFASALGLIARRRRVEPGEILIESSVTLNPRDDRGYMLRVKLDIELSEIASAEVASRLVAEAHGICPYSHATRNNVPVSLTANGVPVSTRAREDGEPAPSGTPLAADTSHLPGQLP